MKITLMWMTRKRPSELVFSISSFICNAFDNSNIEYIVVSDPDDAETPESLKSIQLMANAYNAKIECYQTDKRYGYAELEMYQNLVGTIFTGDCLLIMNDDLICLHRDWDLMILDKIKSEDMTIPRWFGYCGLNERWKGSTTFVGINRKWYNITNRVSGNRATDGYLMDMGAKLKMPAIKLELDVVHLQRGKSAVEFVFKNEKRCIAGLPDDGLGGYPTKNPVPPKYYHSHFNDKTGKTDFVEGKRRFDEDFEKLFGFLKKNNYY